MNTEDYFDHLRAHASHSDRLLSNMLRRAAATVVEVIIHLFLPFLFFFCCVLAYQVIVNIFNSKETRKQRGGVLTALIRTIQLALCLKSKKKALMERLKSIHPYYLSFHSLTFVCLEKTAMVRLMAHQGLLNPPLARECIQYMPTCNNCQIFIN